MATIVIGLFIFLIPLSIIYFITINLTLVLVMMIHVKMIQIYSRELKNNSLLMKLNSGQSI